MVRQWWCMPLIVAHGRQRQADLSEFEASLGYKVSSRIARTVTQRNSVLKTGQVEHRTAGRTVTRSVAGVEGRS